MSITRFQGNVGDELLSVQFLSFLSSFQQISSATDEVNPLLKFFHLPCVNNILQKQSENIQLSMFTVYQK